MIISNLIGGLGNQMFQYACARALSLRTRQPLRLATDQFDSYQQHNGFELLRVFDLNVPQATREELVSHLGMQAHPKVRRLLGRPSMRWATGKKWCNEPSFDYWPGIRNVGHPAYLHGYWQSERYFAEVVDVIRNDFTFRGDFDMLDLAVRDRMASAPCASLHVRRGDYLKGKFKSVYASCDVSYYVEAVQLLRKKFPYINLFAFSDEPEWVKKYLEPEIGYVEIINHNVDTRSSNDMRLMSTANYHIIANSSFSWWAAWLNPSPDKIVISPRHWFLNGTNDTDLIPSSWIRL